MRLADSLALASLLLPLVASSPAAADPLRFAAAPEAPSALPPATAAASMPPAASPTPAPSPAALPPRSVGRDPAPATGFSFGVSSPFSWGDEDFGAFTSYGFAHHYAVRLNYATYRYEGPSGSEARHSGRIKDVGLGLAYYPRRLWSGPSFELGALTRRRDIRDIDHFEDAHRYRIDTDSRVYAGRALVGWSWTLASFYLSVAAGFSVGYELGHEYTQDIEGEVRGHSRVRRTRREGETFFRFGFAFGR